jgi:hypothetical protein
MEVTLVKIGIFASVAAILITMPFHTKYKERTFRNGLPFKFRLMAHRGGSREYVENTIPAFRNAYRLGADILEMDVQMTKDGKIVVFHDNIMDRMCGTKNRIGDFNFEDLPPILIPEDLKSNQLVVNDPLSTVIPLFEDILKEFPTSPMQIDVKNGPERLVIDVGNLIKKYKREHLTVWGSFKPNVCNYCYQHFGTEIPLFFDLLRATKALVFYKIGLLSLMSFKESALICYKLGPFMDPGFVASLESIGISVLYFGENGAINDEATWAKVSNCGNIGICSDRPTLLKEWLSRNSK